MKILYAFPGQGTQTVNMLHQIPRTFTTTALLQKAQTVLDEDIYTLDSNESLQKTRAVQLCDLIAGVCYASLLKEQNIHVDMVCGLSIGAFPAAVYAGALSFEDALRLVSLRGHLMEDAYPTGFGMMSIQGLFLFQIEKIVQHVQRHLGQVYLANYNDENQFVISGSDNAMNTVATLAREQGAARVTRLAVSVPSHCSLLDKPAKSLLQAIQKIHFKSPDIRYLSGSTVRVIMDPTQIAEDLALNMCRSVHWHDAMVAADERGIQLVIEMPPGSVLTSLTKRALAQGEAVSLEQKGVAATVSLVKMLKQYSET